MYSINKLCIKVGCVVRTVLRLLPVYMAIIGCIYIIALIVSRVRTLCSLPGWRPLPSIISVEIRMAHQNLSSIHHCVNNKVICNNPRRFYSTEDQTKLYTRSSNLNNSEKATEDAVPFLQSRAHTFKVKDTYSTDSTNDKRRQKYSIPLGMVMFGVLLYFGFVREYNEKDRKRMDFLNKDISDKLPEDVRKKVYAELDIKSSER